MGLPLHGQTYPNVYFFTLHHDSAVLTSHHAPTDMDGHTLNNLLTTVQHQSSACTYIHSQK